MLKTRWIERKDADGLCAGYESCVEEFKSRKDEVRRTSLK